MLKVIRDNDVMVGLGSLMPDPLNYSEEKYCRKNSKNKNIESS